MVIRDGVLGEAVEVLRRSAEALFLDARTIRRAGTGRGPERSQDAAVRSDEMVWLSEEAPAFAPLFGLFEGLRRALNEGAYLGLERFEVQLARYDRGAHYARHRDAFSGPASRRVTAILYLNPDWRPEQGGQLRIHGPWARDVEPRAGRLALFLSDRVEHEVLPAFAPRFAATAWYYGPHAVR